MSLALHIVELTVIILVGWTLVSVTFGTVVTMLVIPPDEDDLPPPRPVEPLNPRGRRR